MHTKLTLLCFAHAVRRRGALVACALLLTGTYAQAQTTHPIGEPPVVEQETQRILAKAQSSPKSLELDEDPADSERGEGQLISKANPDWTPREKWYGWELIILDSLDSALFVATWAADSDLNAYFTAFAVTNGLLVHTFHRRMGVGFLSLLIRLGTVVGGGLAGCALSDCFDEPVDDARELPPDGFMAGILVGIAAGAGLDAALLAYEPKKIGDRVAVGIAPQTQGALLQINGGF